MDINGIKELYEAVSQSACVTKGESDTRENHAMFKVTCGKNLDLNQAELDEMNRIATEKAHEIVSLDYVKLIGLVEAIDSASLSDEAKEAKINKLKAKPKYVEAIASNDKYVEWFQEFMKTPWRDFDLEMWPFEDIPDKVSGGYMIAIKPMISGFPA